jgi:pimeloyl-ACP methyl ester carboxylesterase
MRELAVEAQIRNPVLCENTVMRSAAHPWRSAPWFVMAALATSIAGSGSAAQELRRAGFVGVQVVAVPDAVRQDLQLPPGIGVLVQALADGGSAGAAGIRPDDVIVAVANRDVAGVQDFVQLARDLRAGDAPEVRVRRGHESLSLRVPIRPRPFEQSPDVTTTYDAISVDGSLRRTIVTSPKAPGTHPAVLYANGIGCYTQESLTLASNDTKLLYGLTRAGFVTMRVEKSGMGDSEGPPCSSPEADFLAEVRAYTAGVRALKQYRFVDPQAVFVLGLSIGGVEAPLIAAAEAVRGVVVINTVAKPFLEYLLDTRRRQALLAHVPYREIDRSLRLDEQCNHRLLVEKRRPDTIVAANAACADHVTYPAPFTFMQQWADVNPSEAWTALDRPVLVVYGTSDFVATAGDHPYLADVINAAHPGAATLRSIPQMDHGLNAAATVEDSFNRSGAGVFQPAVVDVVAAWLRDRTAHQ